MINTKKVLSRCLGKNNVDCWLCGNETDYPQLRYGKELCNKCAEKEDKQDKYKQGTSILYNKLRKGYRCKK